MSGGIFSRRATTFLKQFNDHATDIARLWSPYVVVRGNAIVARKSDYAAAINQFH